MITQCSRKQGVPMKTLIRIEKKYDPVTPSTPVHDSLVLPYHLRDKGRQRVVLESGDEAGLFLDRGLVLRDGDILESEDGLLIQVKAALETLSQVQCTDHNLLTRMAYHLGNRHTAVQIGANTLTYPHDHVLDDMIERLGGTVSVIQAAFHPEDGAYHGSGHGH